MIQRHTIILWKKAEPIEKTFDEIAIEIYSVLTSLKLFNAKFMPIYMTSYSKENLTEFVWNYDSFAKELKKGINKENSVEYDKLGYTLSFVSSKDEKSAYSYQLTVGNKDERFYNTFIVNIPITSNLFDEEEANNIYNIFCNLVFKFKPFWGCISNKTISRRYGTYMNEGKPTCVHWINYWSEDIIDRVGLNKIRDICDLYPQINMNHGILKIKNTAFDVQNKNDMDFYNELANQLELNI